MGCPWWRPAALPLSFLLWVLWGREPSLTRNPVLPAPGQRPVLRNEPRSPAPTPPSLSGPFPPFSTLVGAKMLAPGQAAKKGHRQGLPGMGEPLQAVRGQSPRPSSVTGATQGRVPQSPGDGPVPRSPPLAAGGCHRTRRLAGPPPSQRPAQQSSAWPRATGKHSMIQIRQLPEERTLPPGGNAGRRPSWVRKEESQSQVLDRAISGRLPTPGRLWKPAIDTQEGQARGQSPGLGLGLIPHQGF